MTEEFNVLEAIAAANTGKRVFIDIPELKFPDKFELVEPSQHEIRMAREEWVTIDRHGADIGKSDTDMLNYAIVSMMLYYKGKQVFPEGAKQAMDVMEATGTSFAGWLTDACTELCKRPPVKIKKALAKN